MTGKEMVELYKQNGWALDRICGSHHIMVKQGRRSQSIPCHASKQFGKGLEARLLKRLAQ